MKKVILLLIFGNILSNIFSFSAEAQTQPKDTVYITSSDIKKMVDDKYYVRVPSSDLEQRLEDKVSAAVNNKFNFLYGLIGIISFLIGSILLFNLRNVVGSRIDKELKDTHLPALNKKLDDHISDMKDAIKDNFGDLDKEIDLKIENYFLKNFKVTLDASLVEMQQEQRKALEAQEEFSRKSIEMFKAFNEMRFEKLRANVDAKIELPKTMDGLKDLLKEADKSNDVEMISKALNELSYVSFYLKKDADYEKLIDTYADRTDVEIKETSFVNAALGTLYDYQGTGEIVQREKALKYLNKALRKTSDYGEALGLKLELYMTDIDNAIDDSRKSLGIKEAEKLIDLINSKEISAYETIVRFKRVQASAIKSRYIELAYTTFPEKIQQMEDIAEAYRVKQGVK